MEESRNTERDEKGGREKRRTLPTIRIFISTQ